MNKEELNKKWNKELKELFINNNEFLSLVDLEYLKWQLESHFNIIKEYREKDK